MCSGRLLYDGCGFACQLSTALFAQRRDVQIADTDLAVSGYGSRATDRKNITRQTQSKELKENITRLIMVNITQLLPMNLVKTQYLDNLASICAFLKAYAER